MIEVTARLRFNTCSLGAKRTKKVNKMLRDPQGRVMFLPTWWQALMRYAAKVLNRHQRMVEDIHWDPVIDGTTERYRRHYAANKFTWHEAFVAGSVIGVNAVLPDGLTIEYFTQLLDVAGRYRGISPYKPGEFGTFEVVTVERRKRNQTDESESRESRPMQEPK